MDPPSCATRPCKVSCVPPALSKLGGRARARGGIRSLTCQRGASMPVLIGICTGRESSDQSASAGFHGVTAGCIPAEAVSAGAPSAVSSRCAAGCASRCQLYRIDANDKLTRHTPDQYLRRRMFNTFGSVCCSLCGIGASHALIRGCCRERSSRGPSPSLRARSGGLGGGGAIGCRLLRRASTTFDGRGCAESAAGKAARPRASAAPAAASSGRRFPLGRLEPLCPLGGNVRRQAGNGHAARVASNRGATAAARQGPG